jgi:beta-glucosidase
MNIHRDPLNGRNFEYYSEDPLASGLTAAATTAGVQSSPGVGVTLKHYMGNNQETQRSGGNSVMSERAAREIYLRGFEIAVKAAQPMAVMTSYNRVQGTYASANYDLNTDLLRGEWGFRGLVMTDWGGNHNATATMYSGNDLIMPGNNPAEVITAAKKVAPTVDVAGLPVYSVSTSFSGALRYAWQLGGFGLSATGTQTVSTTVDATSDLAHPQSGRITTDAAGRQVLTPIPPYASVADAYAATQALLAPESTALTAAQKAAITITGVQRDAGGAVTSYTVVLTGDYPASYDMRLGDLQRSATRVLRIAMQSAPFAELAAQQGVPGIRVGPYSGQFRDLATPVTVTRERIRRPHDRP